jgi:hypothetical protein
MDQITDWENFNFERFKGLLTDSLASELNTFTSDLFFETGTYSAERPSILKETDEFYSANSEAQKYRLELREALMNPNFQEA